VLAAPLALASSQRARLERLAAAWDDEVRPLDTALAAARADMEAFVAEANRRGGARLADLQARAADFHDLSARIRERRSAHGAAALDILTPEQRAALAKAPLTAGGTR
jgi:hypothetical protein